MCFNELGVPGHTACIGSMDSPVGMGDKSFPAVGALYAGNLNKVEKIPTDIDLGPKKD